MATDKEKLNKGIKLLSWALPCVFIGPIVINSAFKNQQHPYYALVLGIGVLIAFAGIFLIFKGIITIVNSMS